MAEPRIVRLLVGGALAIAAAWAAAWLAANFELATREAHSGYTVAARRNPLLAAERFLRAVGVEAASVSGSTLWRQPPAAGDVLVVYRSPARSGDRRLREWVEAGGHLIIGAVSNGERTLPRLLDELGVQVRDAQRSPDRPPVLALPFSFSGLDLPAMVLLSSGHYLEDTSGRATDQLGQPTDSGHLLRYALGRGQVTVLNDNRFLANDLIGKLDHALVLALLVGSAPGKVWLVHDVQMPSLAALAWQYAPHALAALLVTALLWLWSLGARLGPLLPPAVAPRRDIGEHLAASADYLWRLDRAQGLFEANRRRIEQGWLARHFMLRHLTQEERCAWIAARSGLSARAVRRALYDDYAGEGDFIELSSFLQVLRANL